MTDAQFIKLHNELGCKYCALADASMIGVGPCCTVKRGFGQKLKKANDGACLERKPLIDRRGKNAKQNGMVK